MEHITIHVQVVPDFILIQELTEKTYHGAVRKRISFLLDHNMCVIEEIGVDGLKAKYSDTKYVACRIQSGKIQTLDAKHGWLNENDATKVYMEEIAEKALLGT